MVVAQPIVELIDIGHGEFLWRETTTLKTREFRFQPGVETTVNTPAGHEVKAKLDFLNLNKLVQVNTEGPETEITSEFTEFELIIVCFFQNIMFLIIFVLIDEFHLEFQTYNVNNHIAKRWFKTI